MNSKPYVLIISDPGDNEKRNLALAWLEQNDAQMLSPICEILQGDDFTEEQFRNAKDVIFPTPADYLRVAGRVLQGQAIIILGTSIDTREWLMGNGAQREAIAVFDALIVAVKAAVPKPPPDPELEKMRRNVETLAGEVLRMEKLLAPPEEPFTPAKVKRHVINPRDPKTGRLMKLETALVGE